MQISKIAGFLLLVLAACQNNPSNQAEFPNVLLILVDDMGFGDLSMAGNPHLKTPHLDEFQSKSVSFEHFYVSPVCAPTRASLLTGQYHQRTGVESVTNGFESMRPEAVTIAELLQPLGYKAGLFGKWHLGEYYPMVPQAQGFNEFLGFRTGHTANYYKPVLEHNGKTKPYEGYITDVLTDSALAFMHQQTSPFFCFLSLNAPHTPLQIDSTYFVPYLEKGLDERTARVYGMMENIDENIGRIFQQLQVTDNLRKTIVIFLSDNGPISGWKVAQEAMRYNAGLRDQKFTIFEGGVRTQCFWYWQDRWPARHIDDVFAAHIDVAPTLLELMPITPAYLTPGEFDGNSLIPVLEGQKTKGSLKDRLLFQQYDLSTLKSPAPFPGGIALQWPWKMVNDSALYRLDQDPSESYNVAAQQPETIEHLRRAYLDWWNSLSLSAKTYGMAVPVGYQEENPILLQPHHGLGRGKVKFTGQRGLLGDRIGTHPSGVDGDWLSNWQQPGDGIHWLIKVEETARYQVSVVLRKPALQSPLSLQLKLDGKIWENTLFFQEKQPSWQAEVLQELDLQKGMDTLHFQLMTDLSPADSLEIRGISLKKLE